MGEVLSTPCPAVRQLALSGRVRLKGLARQICVGRVSAYPYPSRTTCYMNAVLDGEGRVGFPMDISLFLDRGSATVLP